MRKIIFCAHAGQAGTDAHEAFAYPDDVTEETLNEEAWQFGIDNAEMYGIYNANEYTEEEIAEDEESYSDNIEGWWEEYDPKKHDGFKAGGGEWEWEL